MVPVRSTVQIDCYSLNPAIWIRICPVNFRIFFLFHNSGLRGSSWVNCANWVLQFESCDLDSPCWRSFRLASFGPRRPPYRHCSWPTQIRIHATGLMNFIDLHKHRFMKQVWWKWLAYLNTDPWNRLAEWTSSSTWIHTVDLLKYGLWPTEVWIQFTGPG